MSFSFRRILQLGNRAYRVTAAWNVGASVISQSYDGDGLRVKKTQNGAATYYVRSTVLSGQVLAELDAAGNWARGYVYAGSNLMAVQQSNAVYWQHEDPVTKSKRTTDVNGNVVSTIELDPWGADTSRSSYAAFQPKKFTSYERDVNGGDEAMFRRYNRWHSRFDQPDPYDGSYSLGDPQSFNRYAYTQNDPVNFIDPSGLDGEFQCQQGDRMCQVGTVTIGFSANRHIAGSGGLGGHDEPDQLAVIGDMNRAPQNPLPTPKPSPHPAPDRSQQKQFDDCIAPAKNLYRGRFPGAAGRTIAGGAGLAVGVAVLKGAPSVGFGINAAARTFAGPLTRTTLFHGLMEIKDAASIALPINLLSGQLLAKGLTELVGNRKQFEAAVADCAKKWPLSNHFVPF